jgi:ADP-heptose:LPS heptosyltransferase
MPTEFYTNNNIDDVYAKIAIINSQNEDNNTKKFKISELLRRLFFHLITFKLKASSYEKIDLTKVSNVFLIRNDALGDYIQTTPFILILKKVNPQINIDVLCSKRNYELIKEDNNIRNIYTIDEKPNLIQIYYTCRQIKKHNNYDVIFALKHTNTTVNALIANLLSRKAYKVNFLHSNYHRNKTYSLAFTHLVEFPKGIFHWNSYMKYLLKGMVSEGILRSPISTYVVSEKFTRDHQKEQLNGLSKYEELKILVNISVSDAKRQIDIPIISQIINYFSSNYKLNITLTSAPKDYHLLDRINELVSNKNKLALLKTDLLNLIRNLNHYDIVLSPDTGILHFADALKIPIIGIYENYDKLSKWHPNNSPFVAIIPEDSNFSKISEKEITQALEDLGCNLEKLKL